MQYGDIIKRAWTITWRYRALWVLGVFAGVSGCQGGGSSSGGGSGSDFSSGTGSSPGLPTLPDIQRFFPALIAALVVLILMGIVWALVGVAARGGLIHAVDRIERGERVSLGEAWSVGFHHFWRVLGLGLLLQLPIVVLTLIVVFAAIGPLFVSAVSSGEPGPEVIAPICGALGLGLPVVLIASLLLGILYLVALRYLVIGGRGVIDSIRAGWGAMKARKKDHFLMWLVNWGLNIAASIVVAIPIVIVVVATAIPAIFAAEQGRWTAFGGAIGVAIVVSIVVSLVYSAIWGVFTSALWTIFFRKLTGLEPPVMMPAPIPAAPGYPAAPGPPAAPGYNDAPGPPMSPEYPTLPESPETPGYPPAPPAPPVGE